MFWFRQYAKQPNRQFVYPLFALLLHKEKKKKISEKIDFKYVIEQYSFHYGVDKLHRTQLM